MLDAVSLDPAPATVVAVVRGVLITEQVVSNRRPIAVDLNAHHDPAAVLEVRVIPDVKQLGVDQPQAVAVRADVDLFNQDFTVGHQRGHDQALDI